MFNFFVKNTVGLDIADRTIEVVQLTGGGRVAQIRNINRVKFNAGVITNGCIIDKSKLQNIIIKLLQTAKPYPIKTKKLFFAIPESQTYIHTINLVDCKQRVDRQLIEVEIKKNIPVAIDNLVYSYKTITKTKQSTEISIVAVRRDILEEWQEFFRSLKIKVKFDIEIFAARRAILEEKIKQPICLIDIGAVTTQLAIFDQAGLRMSHSFHKAGEYFNDKLASSLKINLTQAAKLKKEINLKIKNKKSQAFIKILEPLVKEIKTMLDFWQNKSGKTLERLILLGGSSQINGLVDYLVKQFELPIELAKSTLQDKRAGLLYLGAIGAALKGVDHQWEQDPTLIIQKNKSVQAPVKPLLVKTKTYPAKIQITGTKQYKSKLMPLMVILIIVAILSVISIFWCYNYQQTRLAGNQQQASNQLKYNFPKTLQLSIPVAVMETAYTTDNIPGRLINDFEGFRKNERLWPQPLQQEPVQWLVFQADIAQQLFTAALDDKIAVDFILDNIDYVDVQPSADPAIYFISAKINFLIQSNVDLQPQIQPSIEIPVIIEEVVPVVEKVIIIDTPTGWLNVRQGPATSYGIITKVNVGEEFILLTQQVDWSEIELPSGATGWVSGQYIKIIK